MILYHGTNIDIDNIDIDKCQPYKDFGKGFYTTTLFDQAQAMAIKRAVFSVERLALLLMTFRTIFSCFQI